MEVVYVLDNIIVFNRKFDVLRIVRDEKRWVIYNEGIEDIFDVLDIKLF